MVSQGWQGECPFAQLQPKMEQVQSHGLTIFQFILRLTTSVQQHMNKPTAPKEDLSSQSQYKLSDLYTNCSQGLLLCCDTNPSQTTTEIILQIELIIPQVASALITQVISFLTTAYFICMLFFVGKWGGDPETQTIGNGACIVHLQLDPLLLAQLQLCSWLSALLSHRNVNTGELHPLCSNFQCPPEFTDLTHSISNNC